MNEKEKQQLLLHDLCVRLPYGVKLLKVNEPESAFELYSIDIKSGEIKYDKYKGKSLEIGDIGHLFRPNGILRFKPYLRPMSSLTEEEKDKYGELAWSGDFEHLSLPLLDWLNKNMFDYRGLISKGLAIEVTEGNNPYKD